MFTPNTRAAEPSRPFLRPADSTSPPASSVTQHYVLRGLGVQDQATLARWLDEQEVHLQETIGIPVPYRRAEIIVVRGLTAPPAGEGSIDLSLGYIDELLQQKMVLVNPEFVTEAEVAERLVLLLLNRYVLSLQGAREDNVIPFQVPAWLSEGLSQNMSSAWRERNARFATKAWKAGEGRSARSIFQLTDVDRMRSDERAFCGMVVEWMLDGHMDVASWGRFFSLMSRGGAVDPEALRESVLGFQDIREMEKDWDVWLAGKTLIRQDLGAVRIDHMLALRSLLTLSPVAIGLTPGPDMPSDLRPADLIERRGRPWVRPYATRLVVELEGLAAGTAPDFSKVIDLYKAYYTALPRSSEHRGGLPGRRSSDIVLHRMLEQAESARASLERELVLRGAYLEEIQATVNDAGRPADGVSPALHRERSDFLDSVEDRPMP